MTAQNFDAALAHVFKVEGGYADHSKDPGGATNYGITRATLAKWRAKPVSKAEVQSMGRGEAAQIYRALYWDTVSGDQLPSGIDLAVFDHAVHAGPQRAMRNLQGAIRVKMDGVLGPQTAAALKNYATDTIIKTLTTRRMAMLERLPTWETFGKGWTRRVNDTQTAALKLMRIPPEVMTPPAPEQQMPMTESKSIFASKTVWGALVAIAAQLLLIAGFTITPQAQSVAVDILTQLVGVGGTMFALWGRLVASHKIG
jgi:lysozyme family protein